MSIIDEMHSWASIVGVGVTGWVEGRKGRWPRSNGVKAGQSIVNVMRYYVLFDSLGFGILLHEYSGR